MCYFCDVINQTTNIMNRIFKAISAIASVVILSACGNPEEKDIVLHYDFSKVEGNIVKDLGPNHADAVLMNEASASNSILSLGNGTGYLDMTVKAGEIMKTLDDFTVSATYRVKPGTEVRGYGYFLWCFSEKEANAAEEGPYHAYRINEQRCETSTGGYKHETGVQTGTISEMGPWLSVIFRQKDGHGELILDGKVVDTEDGFPTPSSIFQVAPEFNWMGRPPFNGDHYLNGAEVYDYRIYGAAISDDEVSRLVKLSAEVK